MAEKLTSLAAEFSAKSADDWSQLAEQSLKGKALKSLETQRLDGITTQPIYARSDSALSAPGVFPYTRGTRTHNHWSIAQRIENPNVANAAKTAETALLGGADALELNFAPCLKKASAPSTVDAPSAQGLLVSTLADMRQLLSASNAGNPISFDAGTGIKPLAALAINAVADAAARQWRFNADPLGALAEQGESALPLETALADLAELANYCQAELPQARSIAADGRHYHHAGASDAQELACVLSTALFYARYLSERGMAFADVTRQLVFRLAIDADQFAGIAKVRALRQLWASVCQHSGAPESAADLYIHAESAERMHTRRDPWVNMLRATTATTAAAIAGVDMLTLSPFDRRLDQDSELGQRMSRNTQLILRDESQLHQVADAAGGSGYIESLTDALCEASWQIFQAIESEGGQLKALQSGFIHATLADTQAQRRRQLAKRKAPITGVSEFPNIGEQLPQDATVDADAAYATAQQAAPAQTLSLSQSLQTQLAQAAEGAGFAVTAQQSSFEALPKAPLDADYETLRAQADAATETPTVALITLGTPADYTGRATFAKNLFEAGGIAAVEQGLEAASGNLAVICSSDAVYAEQAAESARQLKAQGIQQVYLAGRATGEQEAALREAGVDDFIYMGMDVLATLRHAHTFLGGAA